MTDPEDALRDLAAASSGDAAPVPHRPASPAAPQPSHTSKRPASPISQNEPDPSEQSASALAQLSGSESVSAAYDSASQSRSRQHRKRKPDVGMLTFYTAAIPVLITMGLIMLALGIWGVMVKAGNTTLPGADQPDAGQYALVALVCLPIGLLLFAGAGLFFWQTKQGKQKLQAWEDAQEVERGNR